MLFRSLPKLDRKDNSNITSAKTASDKSDDNRFNNSNNKLDYEEEMVKETSYDKNHSVKHPRPWVAKKESWEVGMPEENYSCEAKPFYDEEFTNGYCEGGGRESHTEFQEVYQV